MEVGADQAEQLVQVSVSRHCCENFIVSESSVRAIRTPESCMSPPPCKDTVRRNHLWVRKQALTRH